MELKHQARARRKMRSAERAVRTHLPAPLPPVLLLTDPHRAPYGPLTDPHAPRRAAQCLPPAAYIFRHFGQPDLIAFAPRLADYCADHGHTLLIAADPHLAKAIGADGVHWPEKTLNQAWHWRGQFVLQTASAHSRRALWRAHQAGMQAALVSAIFPSNSPSAGRPLGPARFARLSRHSPLPLYALGGVTPDTAARIAPYGGLAGVDLAAVYR